MDNITKMEEAVNKFEEVVKQVEAENPPGKLGQGFVNALTANPKLMGAKLIELATARSEKKFLEGAVKQLEQMVQHRNNLYIALDRTKKEIELFDKRIEAVNNGEFTLGYDQTITFNDIKLQY